MSVPTLIRGHEATQEQEDIIGAIKRGIPYILVNGFAGAAKTSTLVGVTDVFPIMSKLLYLTFNTSMAESARKVFGCNVEIKTVHAFAMPHILGKGERVRGNYSAPEISRMFDISKKEAYTVLRNFEWFCNSDLHSLPPKTPQATNISLLFEQMDNGEIDKTHSFYLKKFQLNLVNSVPMRLQEYSLAMLDEYQDTNEVTRSIFNHLEAQQRIVVGDTHQNIYGFRGSDNVMDSFDGERFFLTNSFRFGSEIANKATQLLSSFKGEKKTIVGRGTETISRTAISLSRTNAYLVQNVMAYIEKKIYYKSIRDPELIFALPINIARLNAGEVITHRQFTYLTWEKEKFEREKGNYKNFATYIMGNGKENDDAEMIWAGRIADEYTLKELESALEQTHENNRSSEPCQFFLGTAHSAKGLEFDIVKLNEDFKDFFEIIARWAIKNDIEPEDNNFLGSFVKHVKGGLVDSSVVEEFNLFYVAITRAKVKVYFDKGMSDIFSTSESDMNDTIKGVYDDIKYNRRSSATSNQENRSITALQSS